MPIVQGRAIDAGDVEGRELVAVINETMARRYWAGRDPVGGVVDFGSGPTRVVGVAQDGKYSRAATSRRETTCICRCFSTTGPTSR